VARPPAARPPAARPPAARRGRHERDVGERTWQAAVARDAASEDARLLRALQPLLSLPSVFPRVVYLALGFAAITSLAAAYAEKLPLPFGAGLVLLPAVVAILLVSMRHRPWGGRALLGWMAGVIATGIYDCLRLSLVKVGVWDDPIPLIGQLLLVNPHVSFLWGYVWRFLGNGGGMGLAFAMLPWRGVRSGILYGTMICLGLFAVLAIWPVAQTHFFPLTPVVAAGAMAGHWVYGAVLGFLTARWLPPVHAADLAARRPGGPLQVRRVDRREPRSGADPAAGYGMAPGGAPWPARPQSARMPARRPARQR